jgi:hypothetical protein
MIRHQKFQIRKELIPVSEQVKDKCFVKLQERKQNEEEEGGAEISH